MQIVSRGKGQNAVAMAAYRSGEKLLDEESGEVKNYRRLTPPESFIMAPNHAPIWVYDRERLWNEVEKAEKRIDSQLAREMNIALPRELTNEEQRTLVEEFVKDTFISQGMIADVAIHRDDVNNPHFHVMLTMRDISESGFGLKNRSWNPQFANRGKSHSFDGRGFVKDSDSLVDARGQWSNYANRALERAGFSTRIDHRSYAKQGLDLVPTKHIGSSDHLREKKALEESSMSGKEYRPVTKYGRLNERIKKLNQKIAKEIQQGEAIIISLEKKIQERKSDLRYQLERSGKWGQLNDVEKTSIVFVQKRMKQDVNLGVALECRSSIERWERVLAKKEVELREEVSNLKRAKELYQNSQNREETSDQLAKFGFTFDDFRNELKQRASLVKQEMDKINKQKGYVQEGLEMTNTAIQTFSHLVKEEAKVIYAQADHDQLLKYDPIEIHRLVDHHNKTGLVVPINQIEAFLKDRRQPEKEKTVPVIEQYQKLVKDNRFLINWQRKLKEREKEVTPIKISDPKTFAKTMGEITKERRIIAERLKKLKTTLSIVDKLMIEEAKKQYPGEAWIESVDPKTARQLLILNEQEGRVVSQNEILDRTMERNSRELSSQPVQSTSDVFVNELAQGIRSLLADTRNGKSDLDRAAEEQKRRSKRSRDRGSGRGR